VDGITVDARTKLSGLSEPVQFRIAE